MDKEKELDQILGITAEQDSQPSEYYGNPPAPEGFPQPSGYYGNPPAPEGFPQSSGYYGNPPAPKASSTGDNAAETVLATVAYAILIIGVLASISIGIQVGSHGFDNDALGFGIAIGGSILSIISWASCMVLVNISNNVRQIKRNLHNR